MIIDSYRFFASLRMTTKRILVILSEVKDLYIPTSRDIPFVEFRMLRIVYAYFYSLSITMLSSLTAAGFSIWL